MVEYNYDAWGNFVAEKVREVCIGSVTVDLVSLNAFTYRGYYYDKESGLYYLINRYYDPVTGRFISPDDVGYLDFQTLYGSNRYMGNDSNATFLGNKPLFSKYKQFINKPVVVDDTPVYEFSLYDHFSNVKNAIETIGGLAMLFLVQWVKQSHFINELKDFSWSVVNMSDKINYIAVGISALLGVIENVAKGESGVRILSDAVADITLGFVEIALIAYVSGTAASVVPGVGTLIGVVAGLIVGLAMYAMQDVVDDWHEFWYKIFSGQGLS